MHDKGRRRERCDRNREEEIDSLGKATAICDYRDRKGFMAASRLGHILDAIELMLLPAKPAAAVEMLRRVIEI